MKDEPVISKETPPEQVLSQAVEFLDESRYNFACFVDYFKSWAEKVGKLKP